MYVCIWHKAKLDVLSASDLFMKQSGENVYGKLYGHAHIRKNDVVVGVSVVYRSVIVQRS